MPSVTVESIEDVGSENVAITLSSPAGFDALPGQFVLVKATVDGEEETGYYTISSPDVEDTFEVTVAVEPEGTLGPWLADRDAGDEVTIEGPYGDIQYGGDDDAVVLASGPGIGPAVGIGERAAASGRDVAIVYGGDEPPHRARLDALEADGATILVTDELDDVAGRLPSVSPDQVYVFGFNEFVEEAQRALSDAGIDPDAAEIESFGPA